MNRTRNSAIRGLGLYVLLSAGLITAHDYSPVVRQIFQFAAVIGVPVHFLASLPSTVLERMQGKLEPTDQLRRNYAALREHNLILQARLHRFEFLESENIQLRRLLSAVPATAEKVTLAALVAVNPDPKGQAVLINKGTADGVFQGQPVVDAGGIVGQVTRPGMFRSTVSLVTRENQGIPVQAARSSLRAVIYGGGRNRPLRVLYLDRNSDIRTGDLLVTSGLAGRYPAGYPVALVTAVERNLSESFMNVAAEPTSHLGSEREVLLLWLPALDEPVASDLLDSEGELVD